jgi:hypothetical protein
LSNSRPSHSSIRLWDSSWRYFNLRFGSQGWEKNLSPVDVFVDLRWFKSMNHGSTINPSSPRWKEIAK